MAELRSCAPDFTVDQLRRSDAAAVRGGDRRSTASAARAGRSARCAHARLGRRTGCAGKRAAEVVWALARRRRPARLPDTGREVDARDGRRRTRARRRPPRTTRLALSVSIADISASDSPIVRLVDSTIHDALKSEASDIHLETQRSGLVIKYRIDGVLEVVKRDRRSRGRASGAVARQGDRGTRHRRAPHPAGRPLQGRGRRPRDRPARLDHAEPVRRGRRAAHPRPPASVRPDAPDQAGEPRLRAGRARRSCATSPRCPTACCWSPGPPAAARRPRCTRRCRKSTPAWTRSSRSKTRSSTRSPTCCRSRSTRRRG